MISEFLSCGKKTQDLWLSLLLAVFSVNTQRSYRFWEGAFRNDTNSGLEGN